LSRVFADLGGGHRSASFHVRNTAFLSDESTMHLVELLLPLHDNNGKPFGAGKYAEVHQRLTERFGGLTAFTRSPAQGTTTESGKPVHDEIVGFEVMTEALDVSWWRNYRLHLERDFLQDQLAKSPFRRRFRLGPPELRYLELKGLNAVLTEAAEFLSKRLGPAIPPNDGKQNRERRGDECGRVSARRGIDRAVAEKSIRKDFGRTGARPVALGRPRGQKRQITIGTNAVFALQRSWLDQGKSRDSNTDRLLRRQPQVDNGPAESADTRS
jgi:hypothetical protein